MPVARYKFLWWPVYFGLKNNLVQWTFDYLRVFEHGNDMESRWLRRRNLGLGEVLRGAILRVIYLQIWRRCF